MISQFAPEQILSAVSVIRCMSEPLIAYQEYGLYSGPGDGNSLLSLPSNEPLLSVLVLLEMTTRVLRSVIKSFAYACIH